MLNSTSHKNSIPHTNLNAEIVLALVLSEVVFILQVIVKMPTIIRILILMSRINFRLSLVEHLKKFYNLKECHVHTDKT